MKKQLLKCVSVYHSTRAVFVRSSFASVLLETSVKKGNMVTISKKGSITCIRDMVREDRREYSVHPSHSSTASTNGATTDILLLRRDLIPVTLNCIKYKYENKIPLTMLTATDYPSASVIDQTNCDMILVGDSLSMTALGHSNTTSVTMDEMIHHAKAVKRGAKYSFLIGDMPFGSYTTDENAVNNAVRFIKEAEMNAVKLEGGQRVASKIKAIVDAGIVVVGHVGLTPQSSNQLGGFRVVGSKSCDEAIQVWKDALAVKEAGASMIVLECVPRKLASLITKELGIPVIGIGSGSCSGQVLVYHDILGMYSKFTPKFCKKYLDLNPTLINACEQYVRDVTVQDFPEKSHTFIIKEDVYKYVSEYIEKEAKELREKNPLYPHPIQKKKDDASSPIPTFSMGKKKILILGGGSVGSLMAVCLQRSAENQVRVVNGRSCSSCSLSVQVERYVRESRELSSNKHLESTHIQYLTQDQLQQHWENEIDLLIIAVKNHSTTEAIQNFVKTFPNLKHIRNVVTIQNGFNNSDVIRKAFSTFQHKMDIPKVILPIYVYSGVKRLEDHGIDKNEHKMILEQTLSPIISISLPKILSGTELGQLFSENSQFQISSQLSPTLVNGEEIYVDWMKLIVNSTVNPVASLFQVENGGINQNPHMQQVMKQLIREQLDILKLIPGAIHSLGVTCQELKEKSFEECIFSKVMQVIEKTKTNHCSMYHDVRNGTLTEIDHLNGAFVELAKRLKLPPSSYSVNSMVSEIIKAKATQRVD
ncbi:hypothetical protein FDP41_011390 [Naegleria fowleri]|uniref:3-methyl-2-oxobutanoate hydroxymethyltransferase n=1 Tax=Naegleria fowleri TaxID=5763 RepID=A0A6A5C9S4_NAEFO|nr:uncharacterized protein FDP41_011390 [Naegleria fowleri]KAF0982460.1 hypothetical protein FDP41_011390 [Naegleria fowleri]